MKNYPEGNDVVWTCIEYGAILVAYAAVQTWISLPSIMWYMGN